MTRAALPTSGMLWQCEIWSKASARCWRPVRRIRVLDQSNRSLPTPMDLIIHTYCAGWEQDTSRPATFRPSYANEFKKHFAYPIFLFFFFFRLNVVVMYQT